jgi:acyl-CoA thioesterase FadM
MELLGLLHEIRVQFLKKYNISEIEVNNSYLLVREVILEYCNQAFWDNELKISLVIEPQKAKIIFKYMVYNLTKNNITAKADVAMVLVNKENQKLLRSNLFFEILQNGFLSI